MPRLLYYFHLLGARRVLGCDVAQEFVAAGLRSERTFVYDREIICASHPVQMLFADVQRLPIRDESVDSIFCFQAMHHVDMNRFAAECMRILSPGGNVFLSDPVGTHPLRKVGDWVGQGYVLGEPAP